MSDRLSATLALNAPVSCVAGVSSTRATALSSMGIHTVRDLIVHYPRRYLDMSRLSSIADARIGERATVVATVYEAQVKHPRPNLDLSEITLVDDTGTLIATFFRQPWIAKSLVPGMRVSVAGEVEFNYGFKRMTMPFLDRLDEDEAAQGRIVSVYGATERVSSGQIRRLVKNALAVAPLYDPLPLSLRSKYRLYSRNTAWRAVHFPVSMDEVTQARRRLAYEEVLLLEIFLMRKSSADRRGAPVYSFNVEGSALQALRRALPFALTGDQRAAVDDILSRMRKPVRMEHMLLGDVGTGKTIVAAHALAAASDSGFQALMMGPTEVLATQYASALGPLLDVAGITWTLLTGSTSPEERRAALEGLADGSITVAFGTHALIEDDVRCRQCALVVIDEEQRFGVEQRAALARKGRCPDVLLMTATPIPRSLALTLYGSLSLSYLRTVPFDRPPRTTKVLGFRERGIAYDAALAACERGEQVYIVCPLVGKKRSGDSGEHKSSSRKFSSSDDEFDGAEPLIESDLDMVTSDVKAAEAEAAFLQAKTFSEYRVGLLHGRMKSEEKKRVMEEFRAAALDVLVCTTVIEVGVDVLRATVMIVEDADRFGLSQLHQLRGRVGRGELPGEVYLIAATSNEAALTRLSAMEGTDDGFELAEYDLLFRREGDILGNRQHGASALKVVNVARDAAIIEAAHDDARAIVDEDPEGEQAWVNLLYHESDAIFAEEHRPKTRNR